MNKRERMNEQIRRHGENLNKLFGLTGDPTKLAKQLFKIERVGRQASEDENNGVISIEEWERITDTCLNKIDKITGFRAKGIPVIAQGDSRGCCFQIDDVYMREHRVTIFTNMGGLGVIAPTFDGED